MLTASSGFPDRKWREVSCTGDIPSGRIGHTLCELPKRNAIVVWGGVNESPGGSRYLDDLYKYDVLQKHWTQIAMSGDQMLPRAFHTAVIYNDTMYIFGGCNGKGRFNKLYTLSETGVVSEVNPKQEPPSTRYCHSAVVYDGKMVVFGGKCGGRNSNKRLSDLFYFNFNTMDWIEAKQSGNIPPSRSAHAAFMCANSMLVFGGRNADGRCCEDLFEYNMDTNVWREVECKSSLLGRARHSVVVHNNKVVIFGGWNGKKKLNDLFNFYLDTLEFEVVHDSDETDMTLPCRRECHTAVVCQNTMVMFGGRFRGQFMNDVFELPLEAKTLKEYCRDWLLVSELPVENESMRLPSHIVQFILAGSKLHAPRRRSDSPQEVLSTSPEPSDEVEEIASDHPTE